MSNPDHHHRRRLTAAVLGLVVVLVVAGVAVSVDGAARPRRPPPPLTVHTTPPSTSSQTTTASTTTTTTAARRTPQRRPSRFGPFRTGLVAAQLTEPATPGLANAVVGGQPVRVLPTRIRYPVAGTPRGAPVPGARAARNRGPYPLIIFSQGYDYPAEGYAALLTAWARAGFVVADPTYPRTDPAAPGGPLESDIVNHPADLRFVITSLLELARQRSSPLHGLIDTGQIALIGQSDGGDVTLATAANSCCRDVRVGAAVILSGAEQADFHGTYYGSGSPPLLVVQGDDDVINDPGCSVALYGQAPRPKYYLDLIGAPHLAPYIDPGRARTAVTDAVITFLRHYLEHRPGALDRLHRVANVRGVASITSADSLPGRSTYCPGAP